jgi:hypothetical protein
MENNAQPITQEEWNELYELPIVKELFNLRNLTADNLPSYLFGAKFTYDPAVDNTVYTLMRKYKSGEAIMLERLDDDTFKAVQLP